MIWTNEFNAGLLTSKFVKQTICLALILNCGNTPVVINVNDKDSYKYSKMLYERLCSNGIDTILDDRKESVGVKFNDMDLFGIPIRITVGKKLSDDYVELKLRSEEKSMDIKTGEVLKIVEKILNNN